MSANDTQVGGDHYKTSYEHWDLVIKIPIGYLEGCATKHVARWRKKLGIQDLQKALHYLDKLMEVATYEHTRKCLDISTEVERFVDANSLTFMENQFIFIMCTYTSRRDLGSARHILVQLLNQAMVEVRRIEELNVPGTPEDGGHHANLKAAG